MNNESKFHKKPFTMIVFLFLVFVTVLHILRIAYGWQVVIGGSIVPLWFSYFGMFFAAILALMLWRENLK